MSNAEQAPRIVWHWVSTRSPQLPPSLTWSRVDPGAAESRLQRRRGPHSNPDSASSGRVTLAAGLNAGPAQAAASQGGPSRDQAGLQGAQAPP